MSGIGEDDLLNEHQGKPDFNRGAGGEPMVSSPDGSGKQLRYARTSSLGDTLDEKSGLANWKTSKAMEGLGKNPELVAKVIAVTPYEDHRSEWTRLREEAINAGRGSYKADLGTAVHAMSERWEQEPTFDPGEPYRSALEAYSKVQKSLGLKSQMFEVPIVNDTLKVAGTTDRIFETTEPLLTPNGEVMPPGTLLIGDLKTGSSLEYSIPGYAIQLAGYAGGSLYDVEANRRIPTPTINQRWAVIMHLSVEEGTCEFLWVDLEVGRYGAQLANDVREWRRAWRRKEGYKAGIQQITVADADDFIEEEDPDPEPDECKEILVAHCGRCGETWALDFEPGRCTCEGYVEHVDDDLVGVQSEDWREAVAYYRSNLPEPEPQPRVEGLPDEGNLEDLEVWRSYCRRRLEAIKDSEASEWALVRWDPDELVPPKRLETLEQAHALSAFLDRVEAEFQLPFVEGQPVGPKQRGSAA